MNDMAKRPRLPRGLIGGTVHHCGCDHFCSFHALDHISFIKSSSFQSRKCAKRKLRQVNHFKLL
jgi:hypothetical protein